MAPATDVEAALALMREHGGRITPSRRLLLDALFARHDHRTAEELAAEVQARAPDVHLSTIYRNLEELERLGVIVHSHQGHGPATYHLASDVHGHFVCEVCGTMIEVPEQLFGELAVSAAPTPMASPSTPTTSPCSAAAPTAAPDADPLLGIQSLSRRRTGPDPSPRALSEGLLCDVAQPQRARTSH